jgi:hypothetical protein
VVNGLSSRGAPEEIVDYVKYLYGNSSTRFAAAGCSSREILCRRGVRQGDPLSPLLFNTTMDHALLGLREEVGYQLGTRKLSYLAYADDVVLVASSPGGLQHNLTELSRGLRQAGLRINTRKCATLSLVAMGKQKRMVVGAERLILDGE